MSSPALPDDDITKLRREDLQIVLAWAQDRLLNAITLLDARLQMESPGVMACDKALQAGVHTCRKIRAAVDELKAAAAAGRA